MIQTWNATVSKDVLAHLDGDRRLHGHEGHEPRSASRAESQRGRHAADRRRAAVHWESSGGRSLLHARQLLDPARRWRSGFRFGASYTLAKSMDNASSLGAGGAVVAQNDQDLEAEYALSNFDQRHQFSANATWELPFGVGRKWLAERRRAGGDRRRVVDDDERSPRNRDRRSRRASSARRRSVANGTSGSLRADYLGAPIGLDEETLLRFFNTDAFAAAGDRRVRHVTAQRHHRAGRLRRERAVLA